MTGCTVSTSVSGLAISALVIELITSLLGAIGSGLSLYCLTTCKKIQGGMKIHLCLLFTMSLVICGIPLPGNSVVENGVLLCWVINKDIIRDFVACYTILAMLDRNVFAVLAVYRMVAVVFPFRYNTISRKAVCIAVDVTVCISVITLWIVAFVKKDHRFNSITDPSSSDLGYILYCSFLLAPLIITVIAYVTMTLSLVSKNRNIAEFMTPTHGEKDQPIMSVTILILINIALDVPHIIIHLMRINSSEISFVVIHIIYRLHFALDSFIFIGLNKRYRRMVLQKFSSLVQVVSVSDSPHAFEEGTSGAV